MNMSDKERKIMWIFILCFIVVLTIIIAIYAIVTYDEDDGKDDGIGCRNCGRNMRLYEGFCKTCYEGFNEWREDYYEKNPY